MTSKLVAPVLIVTEGETVVAFWLQGHASRLDAQEPSSQRTAEPVHVESQLLEHKYGALRQRIVAFLTHGQSAGVL